MLEKTIETEIRKTDKIRRALIGDMVKIANKILDHATIETVDNNNPFLELVKPCAKRFTEKIKEDCQ